MKCAHPDCTVDSPLFRANAKGKTGMFFCETHMKNTDAPPLDPELRAQMFALQEMINKGMTREEIEEITDGDV
jgi:hypothetical protein